MAKKHKPNFKKKEPNSRSDNREEYSEDLDLNQTKDKIGQPNNQRNR